MLQKIRERATGIVGAIILGLISISFALWGVQNYFIGTTDLSIATVNDVEIDAQEFEQRYAQYRQRLAAQGVDTTLLDDPIRRREFLEAMIDSEVWRQAAARSGVAVTADEIRARIRSIEAFNVDGEFNPDVYLELLQLQGITPQQLEADIREAALVQQIPDVVTNTSLALGTEVERIVSMLNQTRDFSYLVVDSEDFLDQISVADAEVLAHYEANSGRYRSEETVTIEYLELDASAYAEEIAVDEALLRDRFEAEKTRFRVPERRLASHILIEVPEGAGEAAVAEAEATAADLARRARAGEAFDDLAREYSDDLVSGEEGGDLGWVTRGDMVEPFEEALFAMAGGEISDPVRSSFGFHVIALRSVDPERGKTFEEARADLAREYREAEAERQFFDLQGELEERLNYTDVPDLEATAREFGLELRQAGPFSRSGGSGIAARPEVVAAAFSETVLDDGLVSDPVSIEDNHVVFLRVIEHEQARTRPLEEVREQVAEAVRRELAREAARSRAEELEGRAKEAGSLAALGEDGEGLEVQVADGVSRFAGGEGVDPDLVSEVFELPRPEGPGAVHVVEFANGRFAVLSLRAVEDAAVEDFAAQREFMASRTRQSYSSAELSALGRALRAEAKIDVNEGRLSGAQL